MSTERGSEKRSRPQKYRNTTAFKNNLHDTSGKQKLINSLSFDDTCERCAHILQWKVKYRKYKPLSQPKVCVRCNEKSVRLAYRVLCPNCAKNENVCPKCCKSADLEKMSPNTVTSVADLSGELQKNVQSLPERRRRTFERLIRKGKIEDTGEDSSKISSKICWTQEELAVKLEEFTLKNKCDDFDEDDFFSDDSDN